VSLYWLVAGAWAAAGWPYLAFGFLVGSIPFGLVVSRLFFKRDIRASGSGNIGAANALRTLGRKAGIAVLLLDALKGLVAVAAAGWLWFHLPIGMQFRGTIVDVVYPPPVRPLMPLAGAAAVLGHCYTPWLRLRGGKGVATFLGATLLLSGPAALAFCVAWLAIVLPTGFASLGSMLGVAVAGAWIAASGRYGAGGYIFAGLCLAVVVWKHRENLVRLSQGSENRTVLVKR
jgi:glycerol-3-phosphate acyltransferase PlsY